MVINVVLKFDENNCSLDCSQLSTIEGLACNFHFYGIKYDVWYNVCNLIHTLEIDSINEEDVEFIAANMTICLQSIGVKNIEISYEVVEID